MLYFCMGTLSCGIAYFLLRLRRRTAREIFADLRFFSKNGRLNKMNIFGFLMFALNYTCYQFLAIITFYNALKADLNVGVISGIWAINPLFLAILDYILFDTRLTNRHIIGILCLIISATMVSLSTFIQP